MENLNKSTRKSFVGMRRKSLIINEMFTEDKITLSSQEKGVFSKKEYIISLEKEKDQWKSLIKERTKQCNELKVMANYETLIIKESEIKSFLSVNDQHFLSEAPDYLEMIETVKKYKEVISMFNKYKTEIIEHYDEITDEIEKETTVLSNELCSDDLCELCNVKDCIVKEHKFPLP